MPITLVANAAAAGSASATTASINTTGASLIVVGLSGFTGGSNWATPITDSKGNTWTALTKRESGGNAAARLFYSTNPTVGSGHTFTAAMTDMFGVISVMAFSGVAISSPFDVENGAGGEAATSIATGSVTPSVNDELVVTVLCANGASSTNFAINSGFTLTNATAHSAGNNYGGYDAYMVQTTAGAVNPTWSWTNNTASHAAAIATFKAAGGGGAAASRFLTLLGVG